ncbi:hypothetical protein [Aminivibrio sp.]
MAEDLGIRPILITAWRKGAKREAGVVPLDQSRGKGLTLEEEFKALRD